MAKPSDLEQSQARVSGKMAVLLAVIGISAAVGFTSIKSVAEKTEANTVAVARLQERDIGLKEKIDELLVLTRSINERTRLIELKQAKDTLREKG
jgi:hypothetical protein